MKSKPSRRRRVIRWIAFLAIALMFVLYLAMPIGFGLFIVLPYQETVSPPPAGFEAITLTTSDQVTLAG